MSNSTLDVLEGLGHIRQWRRRNLSAYESPVAYDLIICLAIQFASGEKLTVKQLFASLPHSYTAVRQHYRQLLGDGLIHCVSSEKDGRIKYIEPSDDFLLLVDAYAQEVVKTFPSRP